MQSPRALEIPTVIILKGQVTGPELSQMGRAFVISQIRYNCCRGSLFTKIQFYGGVYITFGTWRDKFREFETDGKRKHAQWSFPINNLKLFVSELFILGDLLKGPVKIKRQKQSEKLFIYVARSGGYSNLDISCHNSREKETEIIPQDAKTCGKKILTLMDCVINLEPFVYTMKE